MSLDGNGRYCALSPREGARLMVAECCRNLSTVGALPVAATNNLNFGNPGAAGDHGAARRGDRGDRGGMPYFETPITGGNVSLYNETLGEAIWPTPVVGIVGLMKTATPVTIPFKDEGRTVMLLGGLGIVRRDAVRRHAIRQGRAEPDVGLAAGAGYGVRKARASRDPRYREREDSRNRRTI